MRIFNEISKERTRQIKEKGRTIQHDDEINSPSIFAALVCLYATRSIFTLEGAREGFIKAAALCVAAIEWIDRKMGKEIKGLDVVVDVEKKGSQALMADLGALIQRENGTDKLILRGAIEVVMNLRSTLQSVQEERDEWKKLLHDGVEALGFKRDARCNVAYQIAKLKSKVDLNGDDDVRKLMTDLGDLVDRGNSSDRGVLVAAIGLIGKGKSQHQQLLDCQACFDVVMREQVIAPDPGAPMDGMGDWAGYVTSELIKKIEQLQTSLERMEFDRDGWRVQFSKLQGRHDEELKPLRNMYTSIASALDRDGESVEDITADAVLSIGQMERIRTGSNYEDSCPVGLADDVIKTLAAFERIWSKGAPDNVFESVADVAINAIKSQNESIGVDCGELNKENELFKTQLYKAFESLGLEVDGRYDLAEEVSKMEDCLNYHRDILLSVCQKLGINLTPDPTRLARNWKVIGADSVIGNVRWFERNDKELDLIGASLDGIDFPEDDWTLSEKVAYLVEAKTADAELWKGRCKTSEFMRLANESQLKILERKLEEISTSENSTESTMDDIEAIKSELFWTQEELRSVQSERDVSNGVRDAWKDISIQLTQVLQR